MSTRKNIQNKRGGWHQLTPAKKTGGASVNDIVKIIQELSDTAAKQRTQALQVKATFEQLEQLQNEKTEQTRIISSLEEELANIRESQKQSVSETEELKRQLESINQTNDQNITTINEELKNLRKAIMGQ
jgi:predicted  nucleic acid-binding Zn-ribbon protein